MRLLRFAIINLQKKSQVKAMGIQVGDVQIRLHEPTVGKDENIAVLATAECKIESPIEKDSSNRILVPEAERIKCEGVIDDIANLISVFNTGRRSILSPFPCVAFQFENEDEKQFLESSIGIKITRIQESIVKGAIPFDHSLVNKLMDRLGGVTLLAEAFSSSELGKYREYVRFFELAFHRPFTQVEKMLYSLLKPTPFGYEKAEIRKWIAHRHPSSHADLQETTEVAVTSDVRKFLNRMEQAALDTLFNKEVWHSTSTARRSVWHPEAFSKSEAGESIIRQGSKVSMFFRVYDELGTYPKNMEASLTVIRENWYCKFFDELTKTTVNPTGGKKAESGPTVGS